MGEGATNSGRNQLTTEPIFQQALGAEFSALPESIRDLHDCVEFGRWQGRAEVISGTGRLAQLIRRIFGFPPSGTNIPVTVEIRRFHDCEHWVRNFDGRRFRSEIRLSGGPGSRRITERFGAFRFQICLTPTETNLSYPVERGWFLGVPIPRWMLPISDSTESEVRGEFKFDVAISLPGIGRIVRYVGQLRES